jgi:hypothetical protein
MAMPAIMAAVRFILPKTMDQAMRTSNQKHEGFFLAIPACRTRGTLPSFRRIPPQSIHFMHRFPSNSSVSRFRFAALLFIVRSLLPLVGLPLLLWAVFTHERIWLAVALGVLAAFPMVALVQWIAASKVRCPLCMVPPMVSRGCSKNRRARRLLGSYRLRVAVSALVLGNFRCQYCGEPTQMKARERGPASHS